MAEKEKKAKGRKNFVLVSGYLKENLLKEGYDKSNNKCIRGSLIVAIDETNSHKFNVYVSPTWGDGSPNEYYAGFESLLPKNTVSIAGYLKNNPASNFATAKTMATPLWITGSMEEFTTRKEVNGKNVDNSMVMLRAKKAEIASLTGKGFTPRTKFDCDMYIGAMRPEMKKGEETGRTIIVGLLPDNKGCISKVEFVTGNDKISDYVNDHFEVGQTANFVGEMNSLTIREKKTVQGWGIAQDQYETSFIRERVILGGGGAPKDEDDEGAITKKDVKDGLALREEKIEEYVEKQNQAKTTTHRAKATTNGNPFAKQAKETDGNWGDTGFGADNPEDTDAAAIPDNNLNINNDQSGFNFNDF